MKIYIGGVNAVGKSTIAKEVAKELGIDYFHVTTSFLNYLGFNGDYEKLRALTQEQRNQKLDDFFEVFKKEIGDKSFIFDSHYLNIVRGEVNNVSRPWIRDFDVLVLISAPTDDVWNRIKKDSLSRDRALFPKNIQDDDSKKVLTQYILDTRKEFNSLATNLGKPNLEVLNIDGKKEETVFQLINFIKNKKII